jgi:hypothetical protein
MLVLMITTWKALRDRLRLLLQDSEGDVWDDAALDDALDRAQLDFARRTGELRAAFSPFAVDGGEIEPEDQRILADECDLDQQGIPRQILDSLADAGVFRLFPVPVQDSAYCGYSYLGENLGANVLPTFLLGAGWDRVAGSVMSVAADGSFIMVSDGAPDNLVLRTTLYGTAGTRWRLRLYASMILGDAPAVIVRSGAGDVLLEQTMETAPGVYEAFEWTLVNADGTLVIDLTTATAGTLGVVAFADVRLQYDYDAQGGVLCTVRENGEVSGSWDSDWGVTVAVTDPDADLAAAQVPSDWGAVVQAIEFDHAAMLYYARAPLPRTPEVSRPLALVFGAAADLYRQEGPWRNEKAADVLEAVCDRHVARAVELRRRTGPPVGRN